MAARAGAKPQLADTGAGLAEAKAAKRPRVEGGGKVLVIDNYDSFTYNLVQYCGELGGPACELVVIRNDELSVAEAMDRHRPDRVLVSPGPCTPSEAGISLDAVRGFGEAGIPVLGVCLGHQSIGQVFGGTVLRAPYLMHGKTDLIHHTSQGLFEGLPNPFTATRYHSLVVERETLPDCLEVTAWTEDGLIMGLRHRELPIEGVQFHPESALTHAGKVIVYNFLCM